MLFDKKDDPSPYMFADEPSEEEHHTDLLLQLDDVPPASTATNGPSTNNNSSPRQHSCNARLKRMLGAVFMVVGLVLVSMAIRRAVQEKGSSSSTSSSVQQSNGGGGGPFFSDGNDVQALDPRDSPSSWGQTFYIPQSGGGFGRAVALSGNVVAVSLPGYNRVLLWEKAITGNDDAWRLQAVVAADDEAADAQEQNFGVSVALEGDVLVVGANFDMNGAGSAHVFVKLSSSSSTTADGSLPRAEWKLQAKLTAHDGEPQDRFGSKVAISGNTIVVGAPLDDHEGGNDAGSAYVFVQSSTPTTTSMWTQQAKLTASDGAYRDVFGLAVDIDADTIVVGARLKDDSADVADAGCVYVFVRQTATTWTQQAKINAGKVVTAQAIFGAAVTISGDTLAIGAPSLMSSETAPGHVFVFVRDASTFLWTQEAVLSVEGGENNLGNSLSLQGDVLVAGSSSARAAFVFVRHADSSALQTMSWSLESHLLASDHIVNNERFGYNLDLDGEAIVVTASHNNQGSVYVFDRNSPTLIEPGPADAVCESQAAGSVCLENSDCCSDACAKSEDQCQTVNCLGLCV